MSEAGGGNAVSNPILVSSVFKLVFLSVLSLTILLIIASVSLAVGNNTSTSAEAKDLLKAFNTAWQMGFGAIVGLLGGKAL